MSFKEKFNKAEEHFQKYQELYIFGTVCFATGIATAVAFRKSPPEISDKVYNALLVNCDALENTISNTGIPEWDSAYVAGASDTASRFHSLLDEYAKHNPN